MKVLVTCEAAVEHRRVVVITAPRLRVAHVAPRVEALLALHNAAGVGDGRPAAEVVFVDVVELVIFAVVLHHREHAHGAAEVGAAHGVAVLGHNLAVVAVALLPQRVVAQLLLHVDPLAVVAVGVGQ